GMNEPTTRVSATISTAKQLAQEIEDRYDTGETGLPIGIAQVVNRANSFLVVASGMNGRYPGQATGLREAVLAATGTPDDYYWNIVSAVQQRVPSGSTLFLAGHSLGGMELQNLARKLTELGYHVAAVI